MADEGMRLEVTTPERIFYEGTAAMVELTTTEGEIGVYPKHIPMTMIVAPGVLTITEPEAKETKIDVMRAELALKRALVREKMIQK